MWRTRKLALEMLEAEDSQGDFEGGMQLKGRNCGGEGGGGGLL
jgi:hypothetical protein